MGSLNLKILIFLIFSYSKFCFSQANEPIDTDRPDQSDGVYTLTKNKLQVENGVTIARKTFLNNFMLRYGLTNTTEVRILLDAGELDGLRGLLPVQLSLKQRIIEQQNLLPAIALVGYAGFEKLASSNFNSNEVAVELKLAFENEISDKLAIGYNVGTSDWFNNLNISSVVNYALSKNVSAFMEYFADLQKDATEHNIDAGVLFAILPNLQVDLAGGRSIFDHDKRAFLTIGASYRMGYPSKPKTK